MMIRMRANAYVTAVCSSYGMLANVCSLRKCKELLKCPREYAKVLECARRFLGREPMLEYFKSKTYRGIPSLYCRGWQRSMMLTTVLPSGDRPEVWWGRLHNPECALPEAATKYARSLQRNVYPMCIQPHYFDVMYAIDGFSVYDCRRVPGIGEYVFVRKGGCLPTYTHQDCNKSPSSKSVSKHHYMMLIGPGGNVLCAAMKSGTKLWAGKSTGGKQPPSKRRRQSGIGDEQPPSKQQRTGNSGEQSPIKRRRQSGSDDEEPPSKQQRAGSTSETRHSKDDDDTDCETQRRIFEYWWQLIPKYVDKDLQVEPAEVTCKRFATKIWLV